jgi:hypothetical protein
MPFGNTDHIASPTCWCHPEQIEPGVFLHRDEYQPHPHAAIQGDDACQ